MTKLNRLKVEGFRGIADEIEFEPARINVITGRNNMGKTSLLESIGTACSEKFILHHEKPRFMVNQDFDSAKIEVDAEDKFKMELEVPNKEELRNTLYNKCIEKLREDLSEKQFSENERLIEEKIGDFIDTNFEKIFRNSISIKYNENEVLFTGLRRLHLVDRDFTLDLESEEGKEERVSIFPSKIVDGEFDTADVSASLLTENREKHQSAYLRRFEESSSAIKEKIEEYIREKNLVDDFVGIQDNDVVVDREEGYEPIPIDHMGSGFRSIYALLHQLHASKDDTDVMLFEEPELHQHPGYLIGLVQFLIDFVREEDLQLFLTTHNADLIKEFLNEKTKSEEDVEFLRNELKFINIRETTVKEYGYESAEKALKEDMMDLRGV